MDQFANIWKEHLKISEVTKFGSDFVDNYQRYTGSKVEKFERCCMVGGNFVSPLNKMPVKCFDFAKL